MISYRTLVAKVLAKTVLLVATACLLFSQLPSARDVLSHFCDLDSHGEQLSHDGWEKVRVLFATPGAPRRDRVTIVRDYVVSNPALGGHLKTGHTWPFQNRPTELHQDKSIYNLPTAISANSFRNPALRRLILGRPGRRIRQRRDATRAPIQGWNDGAAQAAPVRVETGVAFY
jgi:hypothetical protein